MNYSYLDSPIGKLLIAGNETAIELIWFPDQGKPQGTPRLPEREWVESRAGAVGQAVIQLTEYFEGRRTTFDLPLAPEGTLFQRAVWNQLREIPYGETISYGELARRIGKPAAARAVGAANGANPLPIVVPCHRVIGADGSLTGFGGGLGVKQALLDLERRQTRLPLFAVC